MRFLAYTQIGAEPNVIVDGARTESTVLTLSHWPKSGTPAELKGDTSTESVFKYLDTPRFRVQVDVISNNHFDEDGLVGIFTLVQPTLATEHRDLLLDVAQAGDFGVFARRDAARIAFTISAHADPLTSPLPPRLFKLPYRQMAGEMYVRQLEILPRLLTDLSDYRSLWEREDVKLTASEDLIDNGLVTIEERPGHDLAVVRLPEHLSADRVHRFTQQQLAECHPFALHNRTTCSRRAESTGREPGSMGIRRRRPNYAQACIWKVA